MIARICLVLFIAIVVLLGFARILHPAQARDLGQWTHSDPDTKAWFRGLMMPDHPTVSCCGDADAYWCDDISVKDGHVFCAITDTRDDAPLGRPHRRIGEVHEIPPEKMKFSPVDPQPNAGNPTGHAIIFLGAGDNVFCFVPDGGV